MTQPLTFDEFRDLAERAERIAVFQEIPMATLTPIHSYQLLSNIYGENGVIFENLYAQEATRYSYICFDPIASLTMHQDDKQNPLNALRNLQAKFKFSTRHTVASLINCAMGFITYDAVRYFENIPDRHAKDPQLPILLFHFYALNLTFDHKKQSILISTVVEVSADHEGDYQKAQQKIAQTIELLVATFPQKEAVKKSTEVTQVKTDVSDADFITRIEKAKEYIIAGDAFQIVLSRCFKRSYSVPSLEIYTALCDVSPAPFMFYFPTKTGVILGASPERLVSVVNRKMMVNPIAGTRKRTAASTDESIAADLLGDTKELAEHMMLVDLARNDVGSVSEPGSVAVNELLKIKHYSHVTHITSTVTGKLRDKQDAYDAFFATFPAGTLSGAPKIRAMEIIDELEMSRRGIYGGAICRIDGLGNFDSCIAIRMAVLQDGVATIRVGAGIVYDSKPASEVQETYQKAQSMLHAIAAAHGDNNDTNYR